MRLQPKVLRTPVYGSKSEDGATTANLGGVKRQVEILTGSGGFLDTIFSIFKSIGAFFSSIFDLTLCGGAEGNQEGRNMAVVMYK